MSILMTVEELAKYLKIKPDTIYKKVRKGELPAIKLGKLVRFPKELIDGWILEQATKTVRDVKAAKKMVEQKMENAVDKVEQVVEHAKEQAEFAVEEVKKTQENLTRSLKGLWNDINNGFFAPAGVAAKPSAKSTKKSAAPAKAKTKKKAPVKASKKSKTAARYSASAGA